MSGEQVIRGPVVLVGATATGKSELALELAATLPLEVINADALQMYRGLDIGAAKPSIADRKRVPHHCLDLWDIADAASVAEYQVRARLVTVEVMARGHVPLIVGGSALYVRALADTLDIPPHDPQVRARLVAESLESGGLAMHDRLRSLDPAAADAIDPRNLRRVIRALEVVALTGSFTARMPPRRSWQPTLWLGVDVPRPQLDDRIMVRTAKMWRDGLLAETKQLLSGGLARAPTAGRAIGYAQAMAVASGDMPEDAAREEQNRLTRRLARRQQRAFRQDARIRWVTEGASPALRVAGELIADWTGLRGAC